MNKQSSGFTIVELLVVIVVIGILAAITIVSYSGISSQAIAASVKSDLSSSSRILKVFNVNNGLYPATVSTDCSTNPDSVTNKCLKLSQGNVIDDQPGDPGYQRPTAQSFILRIRNGTRKFVITDNSEPGEVAPLTAIADISGNAKTFTTLTAGAISPAGATAAYRWQSSSDGTNYNNISGATSASYIVAYTDLNNYIRVVATGTGSYYGEVISNPTVRVTSDWIAGRNGTAMTGKYVYFQNSTASAWGPLAAECSSPYCSSELDPSGGGAYPGQPSLVANNSVNFSQYPARDQCKTVTGRLPTVGELQELYNGRVTYGNNFGSTIFWSATGAYDENGSGNEVYSYAMGYNFSGSGGVVWMESKNIIRNVRCVR